MGKMIGIDLGTTNTVVAIMDGPRPKVIDSFESKPEMRGIMEQPPPAPDPLLDDNAPVFNEREHFPWQRATWLRP